MRMALKTQEDMIVANYATKTERLESEVRSEWAHVVAVEKRLRDEEHYYEQ